MTGPSSGADRGRRDFLAALSLGALTAVGGAGCKQRARAGGTAANAREVAAILPTYQPLSLVPADIPAQGPIPAGFLHYPRQLVRVIREKPGRGGPPITTMTPRWGPIPPGLGRNSFLDAVNAELGVAVAPSPQEGATFPAKLSTILGARDVPDLLCVPSWMIYRVPRFSHAVQELFEDLTPYLGRGNVSAYPMLATIPTSAWQHAVWGGRLAAVPSPAESPFPWALFHRKDLTDRAGVEAPQTIDQLYEFGKKLTDAARGVWAFGPVFNIVQMFFKCPESGWGWRRKPSGGLEHRYETLEFRQALEFSARLTRERLVHPTVMLTRGTDHKPLFNAGKLLALQDGMGAWRGTQSVQAKVTPGFDMQPVPVFSAVGGEPLSWARDEPSYYTFLKKGLARERVEELLRVLDWCAAPFGSWEHELNEYGMEGKHFTRAADGSPLPTALGRSELAEQYRVLGGRAPALVATADVPRFVPDVLEYSKNALRHLEPNPFAGIKLELPPSYSRLYVNTEDQIHDILLGRRPLSDLARIVTEWRQGGGDEGRAFFEQALADNGR